MDKKAGVFLSFDDCRALFPGLKGNEPNLSSGERKVLIEIEKLLYGELSIGEIEDLLERGSGPARARVPGGSR